MKVLAVVSIVVAVAALTFVVVAGGGNLRIGGSEQAPPIILAPPEGDTEFGKGNVPQIRPTDVRVRVRGWELEIPPASWDIEIYNGKSSEVTFKLEYQVPTEEWPGYSMPPSDAGSWVSYSKQTLSIPPKTIGRSTVTLEIPSGVVDYDWAFWIVVSELTGGNVVTRVAVWWLIEMK